MRLFFLKLLITNFFLVLLIGCVNLKKVNDYSSNSVQSLKNFEEIGYTFSKACKNRCEIDKLKKEILFEKKCDCDANKDADSITLVLYNTIRGYFDGLSKLSNNDLTNYKFDALTKALTEGKFGEVTINKDHVDSYTKISKILLRAFTDSYRKRKISTYIGQANEPIQTLITTLAFNLEENLSKKLDIEKERYTSYYFDLSRDANASAYEKKKVIEEYSNVSSVIESKKKQILTFGKGLRGIREGHQKLYENRNSLKAKEIKELLTQYSSDLQDVINEFNKLKNEN